MAKGYLLGGLRQYIPGDDGNPLYRGRVSFYVAGSQTPAPVYKDMALTKPWGTSVTVDSSGLVGNSENGVWLKTDHLYLVKVETLSHYDSEGREVWKPEWQVDNVGYVPNDSSGGGEVVTQTTVQTIAELKALQPGSSNVVIVNGWYSYLDAGSPMVFKWNASADASQEDGHWIRPTGYLTAGRWEQIFSEGEVDVRKFGAIPDTNSNIDTYIDDALSWATEPHVYESGTGYKAPRTIVFAKAGEYRISASIDFTSYKTIPNFGSRQVPVVINDGVFFSTQSSGIYIKFGNAVRCMSSESICTSGIDLKIEEYSMAEVNPVWWGVYACSVKGCVIVANKEITNNVYLEDCVVNAVRKFSGAVTMKNCIVSDKYFVSGYDFDSASFTNCKFTPATEWDSAYNWIKCKSLNGDDHYDFGGLQTALTGLNISSSSGSLTIENARSISGLFSATSVVFRDVDYVNIYMEDLGSTAVRSFYRCTVNGIIDGGRGSYSVYAEDCKINCTMASGNASLVAKGCTISSSVSFDTVSLTDCSSTDASEISAYSSIYIFGCSIYKVSGSNVTMYDSHVFSLIESTSSAQESGASVTLWNSAIVNSVVEALSVTNGSSTLCRVNWENSSIRNLTFTECTKTGSLYSVKNCNVSTADGRVWKNEYKVAGSFGKIYTGVSARRASLKIDGFLSFVALGDPTSSGSTGSEPVESVVGVINMRDNDSERYAFDIINSPSESFIMKKDGSYYLVAYTGMLFINDSYAGTAVFDVLR